MAKGVDPNERNDFGRNAVHELVECCRNYSGYSVKDIRDIGKALIKNGVDLDAKISRGGYKDLSAEDLLFKKRQQFGCQSDMRAEGCDRIDALLEVIREAKEKQSKG